jgi:hypothetical protein
MLGNLIAGIVSGLFVTLSVFVFRILWKSKIEPWFEERVYKDAKIEGQWLSVYPAMGSDAGKRQEIIVLTRRGHAVTGTMTCIKNGGRDDGQQYDLYGSFRNMILPLTYETHDRQKTDRGTIALKLTYNAGRFEGSVALYVDATDSIQSTDVVWFRSKKDVETYLHDLETSEKAALEEYTKRSKEAAEAAQKLKRETAPKQGLISDGGVKDEAKAGNTAELPRMGDGVEAELDPQAEGKPRSTPARADREAQPDENGSRT